MASRKVFGRISGTGKRPSRAELEASRHKSEFYGSAQRLGDGRIAAFFPAVLSEFGLFAARSLDPACDFAAAVLPFGRAA